MENVDVQRKVKKTRENTFGNTPEVQEVKQPAAAQKAPAGDPLKEIEAAVAKQNKEAAQSQPATANQVQLKKGFTVGIDEKGIARLVPFGNPNFLELVGLMRYTDTKQGDILADLAMSKEAVIQNSINKLNEDMSVVAKGVSSLLSK